MITKLATDLNIVQTLTDEPNDIEGLTSAQVKAKFDEPGNLIKTYINAVLTPEIDVLINNANDDRNAGDIALQNQIDNNNDTTVQTLQNHDDRIISNENSIVGLAINSANYSDSGDALLLEQITASNNKIAIAENRILENEINKLDKATYDAQVINAGNSNAEIVEARSGEVSLPVKIGKIDTALADNTQQLNSNTSAISNNTTAILNVASGTPRTTYSTLALLQVGIPLGDIYSYVLADGHRYWWNGSVWVDGGLYQSTGIAENAVGDKEIQLNNNLSLVDKATTDVTGKTTYNRNLISADFMSIRGAFNVDGTGALTVVKDVANFTTAILTDVDEFEFEVRLGHYLIFAEHGGIAYGFDTIQKKIYEFKSNYTVLGALIATLTYTSQVALDKINVSIVDGELVLKKNGIAWFTIPKTTVEANMLGILITSGVVDGTVIFNKGYIVTKKPVKSLREEIESVTTPTVSYGINKWGIVGDSISVLNGLVNEVDYGVNWTLIIKSLLNITTLQNTAVGGARLAFKDTGNATYDPMAMVRRYTTIDNDCDLVTVMGGTNDFAGNGLDGVPMGVKGSVLETEFYGALKIIIEGLITKLPNKKIVFLLPLKNIRESATNVNLQGHKLQDYRNAIIDMCSDYAIPCYRLHENSMMSNYTTYCYVADRIHPNAIGNAMIAPKIANFIKAL